MPHLNNKQKQGHELSITWTNSDLKLSNVVETRVGALKENGRTSSDTSAEERYMHIKYQPMHGENPQTMICINY